MAFVRKKAASYKWPLKLEVPSDGGAFDIQTMTVVFKRLPQSRIETIKANRDLLLEAIVGWSDYADEAGKDIPFSNDELKELLDDTVFLRAATKGFFESLAGAKEGN